MAFRIRSRRTVPAITKFVTGERKPSTSSQGNRSWQISVGCGLTPVAKRFPSPRQLYELGYLIAEPVRTASAGKPTELTSTWAIRQA